MPLLVQASSSLGEIHWSRRGLCWAMGCDRSVRGPTRRPLRRQGRLRHGRLVSEPRLPPSFGGMCPVRAPDRAALGNERQRTDSSHKPAVHRAPHCAPWGLSSMDRLKLARQTAARGLTRNDGAEVASACGRHLLWPVLREWALASWAAKCPEHRTLAKQRVCASHLAGPGRIGGDCQPAQLIRGLQFCSEYHGPIASSCW